MRPRSSSGRTRTLSSIIRPHHVQSPLFQGGQGRNIVEITTADYGRDVAALLSLSRGDRSNGVATTGISTRVGTVVPYSGSQCSWPTRPTVGVVCEPGMQRYPVR